MVKTLHKSKLIPFLCYGILLCFVSACALDADDIAGTQEDSQDRLLQKQLDNLKAKYQPAVGRYKGIFSFNKKTKTGIQAVAYPIEIRLHILPFLKGFKNDGTPIEIPRLIGHFDYKNEIVHEIEYVSFVGNFNNVSGEIHLNHDNTTDPNSTVASTALKGFLNGNRMNLSYFTKDGLVGTVDVKKYSNSVPSLSPDEIQEQKKQEFGHLYSKIAGDYIGLLKSSSTPNSVCARLTFYTSYGKTTELRAIFNYKVDSGLNLKMFLNAQYSPLTDRITLYSGALKNSDQPPVKNPNPLPVTDVGAYGTFKNGMLDLPHFEFQKGKLESFKAKRYKKGKQRINEPKTKILCQKLRKSSSG